MSRVRINQGRSIPFAFRCAGTLFVIVISILILGNLPENLATVLAISFSFLIPMMWFSFNVIIIDSLTKELHSGIWVMGHQLGKSRKFGSIVKIFINKVKTSRKMHSQVNHGYTVKGIEYQAYLRLDDGEKYFLFSHASEKKVEEKVEEIKKKLMIK